MIAATKTKTLESNWNLLDTLQFWRIKTKISFYKKRRVKKIEVGFIRPAVQDKLEDLGYQIYFYDFGENSWNEIIITR